MKRMLLTICIPTYNRSSYLKKGLQKLVHEVERNRAQHYIEVLVGNNKSNDDTGNVLKYFRGRYFYIRYMTHKRNLGFSGNILKLIEGARGEYLWFMSDDDFIYKNALREIEKKIKQYKPSLMYINYDARVLDTNKAIENMLHLKRDYFFYYRANFFNFFTKLGSIYLLRSSYLSFISMMIVKKDILLKNYARAKKKRDIRKELFPHTWLLWLDFPRKDILLIKKSLFEQSFSHASHSTMVNSWFHSCINFARYLTPVYFYILTTYKKESNFIFKIVIVGGIIYSYMILLLSFVFYLWDGAKHVFFKITRSFLHVVSVS